MQEVQDPYASSALTFAVAAAVAAAAEAPLQGSERACEVGAAAALVAVASCPHPFLRTGAGREEEVELKVVDVVVDVEVVDDVSRCSARGRLPFLLSCALALLLLLVLVLLVRFRVWVSLPPLVERHGQEGCLARFLAGVLLRLLRCLAGHS